MVLHIAYYLLLDKGYRVGDLSLVYPLARGTGPLIAVAAAILFLGEHPISCGRQSWTAHACATAMVIGFIALAVG